MKFVARLLLFLWISSAPALSSAQEISGIGIALGREGADFVIRDVIPGSPAALSKAFHAGDRILAIAQGEAQPVSLKGMSLQEVAGLIRGPKGTAVRVTVAPQGKEDSDAQVVKLVRGELNIRQWNAAHESLPLSLWLLRLALAHP